MELGYKKRDEEEQKLNKKNYESTQKWILTEWYQAIFMGGIWLVVTIVLGIQSIFDRSKFPIFVDFALFFVLGIAVCWGGLRLIQWFLLWINKRMYIRDIPKKSKRTLKNILNRMRFNYGCILWDSICITFAVSFFVVYLGMLFSDPLSWIFSVLKCGKQVVIVFAGHFFFKWIHKRKDCTQKMLKLTRKYYNYGDETQEENFTKYVEWSLRNHMLLNCRSIVLTDEFLLGSADSNAFFYPVAIPRDFIKEAELRMICFHERTRNSAVRISEVVLACKLNNEKVVQFYLARNQGVGMVVTRLEKSGFKFTSRTDMVEYR